jgi:hypothetical protein
MAAAGMTAAGMTAARMAASGVLTARNREVRLVGFDRGALLFRLLLDPALRLGRVLLHALLERPGADQKGVVLFESAVDGFFERRCGEKAGAERHRDDDEGGQPCPAMVHSQFLQSGSPDLEVAREVEPQH